MRYRFRFDFTKPAVWPKARMVEMPVRVSPKWAKMGEPLMPSNRLAHT